MTPAAHRYGPKTRLIMSAMEAEPMREWTAPELGAVGGIPGDIANWVKGPLRYHLIHRRRLPGKGIRYLYRWTPYEDQAEPVAADSSRDARVPQVVAGWVPPKMVCVRPGAEVRLPSLGAFTKEESHG